MAESIFPKVNTVSPRILCECLGGAVARVLTILPTTTDLALTTHRGAEAMLSEALNDNQGVLDL